MITYTPTEKETIQTVEDVREFLKPQMKEWLGGKNQHDQERVLKKLREHEDSIQGRIMQMGKDVEVIQTYETEGCLSNKEPGIPFEPVLWSPRGEIRNEQDEEVTKNSDGSRPKEEGR